MNIITSLLDIEDNALELLSCEVQGLKKIVTVGNVPIPHFCPNCSYKMQIYYEKVKSEARIIIASLFKYQNLTLKPDPKIRP